MPAWWDMCRAGFYTDQFGHADGISRGPMSGWKAPTRAEELISNSAEMSRLETQLHADSKTRGGGRRRRRESGAARKVAGILSLF